MLSDDELKKFRDLLEKQFSWPHEYLFKFIVPFDQVSKVEALFPKAKLSKKGSRLGNYVSLTVTLKMESPDVVVAVYQQASQIRGLIAL